MTYDQAKATDRAGDDADLRLEVCPECRAGEHADCSDLDCACDCGLEIIPRDGEE